MDTLGTMLTKGGFSGLFAMFFHCLTFFCILVADGSRDGATVCEFPSDLQTNVTDRKWSRDWQGRIKQQFTEFTLKIEITGNVINTISTDASMKSNRRTCVQVVDSDKYLVMHEESGQIGSKYTCLQFIFRSSDVIQIRYSPLSSSMDPNLCSDDVLILDKWLIVDKIMIGNQRSSQPCLLQGGFNIVMFDKSRRTGVCDAWKGEIRMESDCSHGDGLTFYFRSQRCVPDGMYMYATQQTYCVTNWNEGPFTFLLLRHNIFNYSWILRFPTQRKKTFTAYLLKDLYSDTTEFIQETYNYLRLESFQDEPHDMTMLCRDDYEICTTLRAPCTTVTSQHLAITCPDTCGICNRSSISPCNINPDWMGMWVDGSTTGNSKRNVTVNSTTLMLTSNSTGIENYRCIRWNLLSATKTETTLSTDAMFLTEYVNGCRPRYTCARTLKQSSSMLHIEFSKTMMWPLIKSHTDSVSCSEFSYTSSNGHLLLYKLHKDVEPMPCNLPSEALDTFQIQLPSGSECVGNLTDSNEQTGFDIDINSCPNNSFTKKSFICLDSSNASISASNRMVIIAKDAKDASNALYCWLYAKTQSQISFYLLHGEQCHQVLMPNIQKNPLQYILRGTKLPRSAITQDKLATISDRRQSIRMTTDALTQKPTEKIIIQPSTEQETIFNQSIFVVVVVVIIFAILQAIFFCLF